MWDGQCTHLRSVSSWVWRPRCRSENPSSLSWVFQTKEYSIEKIDVDNESHISHKHYRPYIPVWETVWTDYQQWPTPYRRRKYRLVYGLHPRTNLQIHKTILQTLTAVRDTYQPRDGQPLQAHLLWKVPTFPCESTKWNGWQIVNKQLPQHITWKGERQRQRPRLQPWPGTWQRQRWWTKLKKKKRIGYIYHIIISI